jgi:hypothetical protein
MWLSDNEILCLTMRCGRGYTFRDAQQEKFAPLERKLVEDTGVDVFQGDEATKARLGNEPMKETFTGTLRQIRIATIFVLTVLPLLCQASTQTILVTKVTCTSLSGGGSLLDVQTGMLSNTGEYTQANDFPYTLPAGVSPTTLGIQDLDEINGKYLVLVPTWSYATPLGYDKLFSVSSKTYSVEYADFYIIQPKAQTAQFASGTYQGLFYDYANVAVSNAGMLTASVTASGSYSGRLLLAGKSYSFAGKLQSGSAISNNLTVNKKSQITITMQPDASTASLTGLVYSATWSSPAMAFPAGYSKQKPWTGAGAYTVLIPGTDDSTTQPGGEGYASLTVRSQGTLKISGKLADGTAISLGANMSLAGLCPLYAPLYSGKGVILGWLVVASEADSDLYGRLFWIKQVQKAACYPGGFTNQTDAIGSAYTLTNGQALVFSSGTASFNEGSLPAGFANDFLLNKLKGTSTNKTFNLSINAKSGIFSGSVSNPFVKKSKALSFQGAVLQKQNLGYGFFMGSNQSGRVVIQAR